VKYPKKSSLIGGIIVSLPIVSILALLWLWIDTKDKVQVAQLSTTIFWLVIPSLVLFISLPVLLKKFAFGWALLMSCTLTIVAYYLMIGILGLFHIKL
jgi:hypothetical protein